MRIFVVIFADFFFFIECYENMSSDKNRGSFRIRIFITIFIDLSFYRVFFFFFTTKEHDG